MDNDLAHEGVSRLASAFRANTRHRVVREYQGLPLNRRAIARIARIHVVMQYPTTRSMNSGVFSFVK